MSTELRWWRLETDSEGKVLSCRLVEGAKSDGEHVFYVKAHDAKEAARRLSNEISRRLLAERRAKYRAEGRCKCGGWRDRPGFKQCQRCYDLDREHERRYQERRKGKEPPPRDRRLVLQERKQLEQSAAVRAAEPNIRLAVLQEVSQAWQDATTNGAFTRWLNQQIAEARGKKVA